MAGPTESPETIPVPARKLSAVQIYEDLRSRILRRDDGHRPGDRLPSQGELADLYSVHRSTISRAMMLLAHDGLVHGRGGAGTWVLGEERPAEDYLP